MLCRAQEAIMRREDPLSRAKAASKEVFHVFEADLGCMWPQESVSNLKDLRVCAGMCRFLFG